MDARHHPFDVLFGSAMGILVAWGSYRQYFPPVGDSWLKGRAYPIRTWGKEMKAPNEPESIAMEPLRRPMNPPAGSASEEPQTGATGNVFRDQVSRSQRQRRTEPSEYNAADVNAITPRRNQEWSEPSSGDEEEHLGEDTEYRGSAQQALPKQRTVA